MVFILLPPPWKIIYIVNMQHIINVDMQVGINISLVFVCALFQKL